jgi:hypothetical protein
VVGAVGKGIAAPAMAANEFVEIVHGALEGALDLAEGESKVGAALDRFMNQRLMITLNSYGPPKVSSLEKAYKVGERYRFIDLLVLISQHI